EHSIAIKNMYNIDKTGVRISIAKNSYVYTKHRKQSSLLLQGASRMAVTLVRMRAT
ncbi:hypothetical protein BCR34DRAFT_572015, partial [Clohesyomyces aquaticus]